MLTSIKRSALVLFSAEQMYNLVNDVESYPLYMEDCCGAEILQQDGNLMVARLDLRKKGVSYSFTTSNRLSPFNEIRLNLHSGPFKALQGGWVFKELTPTASKVSLNLEFEINSGLVGIAASSLFAGVANNLVAALTDRATTVYGKSA